MQVNKATENFRHNEQVKSSISQKLDCINHVQFLNKDRDTLETLGAQDTQRAAK